MTFPDSEIIDPHIHLFDVHNTPRPTQRFVQLFGWNERLLRAMLKRMFPKPTVAFFSERTSLVSDYLTPEYRADSVTSDVGRYVHIEAGWKDKTPMDAVGETAWLESLADPPAAIVAHADLAQGAAISSVLAAHRAASSRVRGIRHMLSHHQVEGVMDFAEDEHLSQDPGFRAGFDQLAEHDLSFDAWCYSGQLGQVAELAASNSNVPLVLCHVGTPVGWAGEFQGVGVSAQERARISDEWLEGLQAVAANAHAHVKISGLLMPALGFGYERASRRPTASELVDRFGPLVRPTIEAFGVDRCMVASNFPVDRVSADYNVVFDALVELTNQDGPDAQAKMFGGNAADFYRI
jgi:predicted TIM-barrel fold metal-dependent hydrolase